MTDNCNVCVHIVQFGSVFCLFVCLIVCSLENGDYSIPKIHKSVVFSVSHNKQHSFKKKKQKKQ